MTEADAPGLASPCVLAIAGSDSSARAGMQADLRTITANGGYGVTAVTAVTAQTKDSVTAIHRVPASVVHAQIDAARQDFEVAAVKTGMLVNADVVDAVANALSAWQPRNLVIDPVMTATSGRLLLDDEGVEALRDRLMPLARLITPNVPEAERLAGAPVRSLADAHAAGEIIMRRGAKAVLIKGGHLAASPGTDLLIHRDGTLLLHGEFLADARAPGTGCTLASAIATWLAKGTSLVEAVSEGKAYVRRALLAPSPAAD